MSLPHPRRLPWSPSPRFAPSMNAPLTVSRLLWLTGLVGCLLLGSVRPATAQGEAPQPSDPQLPEIAPREIEIRGELQINFPSLQRQPLTGFATTPSIPSFPADHLPTTERYKQPLDQLPQSLPQVDALSSGLATAPDPATGLLEAGGGRYFHRFTRGRITLPVTSTESFSIRGDYVGSNGFEPYDGRSVSTPFDQLDGSVHFDSRRANTIVGARLYGFYDDYSLYGALPTELALAATPERTGSQLGGAASFRWRGPVPLSLGVSYDRTEYDTQTRPPSDADAQTFDEGRLTAHGSVEFPVGPSTAVLDARVATSGLDGGTAFDGDVVSLDGGGRALLVDQGPFRVHGGLRVLTFSAQADPQTATPGEASATFFTPFVDATWSPSSSFTVYAHNHPRLRSHDLASVYGDNPFAQHAPSVRPTLETTNAEGGVHLTAGPVRLTGRAGYRYAPSFQYFGAPTSLPYSDGVFEVNYSSARILHGGAGVALHGFDRVQASLDLTVQDGQLVSGDRDIPNFAPVTVDGMVTVSFAEDRGFVKLTSSILGPRPLDVSGSEDVGTYAEIDVEGSYAVSPLLDVLASIENIGAMERWNRYPRPPAVVSAGLRIHW